MRLSQQGDTAATRAAPTKLESKRTVTQKSRFQPHRRHDHRSGQEYSQGPDGDRTGRSPLLRDDLPLNRGHYRPENDSYGRSPLLRDSQYETERRSRNDRYNDEREGAVGGVGSQRRTARTEGRERSRDRNHYYTPRGNARNDFQHGQTDSRYNRNQSSNRQRSNSRRGSEDFGIFD